MNRVAKLVREARLKMDISAEAVSCALGRSPNFITELEKNRMKLNLKYFREISRFLEIDRHLLTVAYLADVHESIENSLKKIET
jgi:ribosome-binding protein aMBF1 (putative translation factor)